MRNNDPLYDDLNGSSFLGRNVTGVSPWVTDFWFAVRYTPGQGE